MSPSASTAEPRRFQSVVEALEDEMNRGLIRPGDRLPSERDLMLRHGVGRGSVREALFTLQRMGLVRLSRGERACAIRPTAREMVQELSGAARRMLVQPDGVRHFQHARRLLECALAGEAAERADPVSMERLREALNATQKARGLERAIAADVQFHACIAEMAGNPVLTALQNAVGEWLREQRSTSVQAPQARTHANAAHQRIYTAIAARDADQAMSAMRQHLNEVEQHYWEVVPRASRAAR